MFRHIKYWLIALALLLTMAASGAATALAAPLDQNEDGYTDVISVDTDLDGRFDP